GRLLGVAVGERECGLVRTPDLRPEVCGTLPLAPQLRCVRLGRLAGQVFLEAGLPAPERELADHPRRLAALREVQARLGLARDRVEIALEPGDLSSCDGDWRHVL